MTYRTVFDVAASGYSTWSLPAGGLVFVAIGVYLVANRKALSDLPGTWRGNPRATALFAYCFLAFSILWTAVSFHVTYRNYSELASSVADARAQVVEGRVHDFRPARWPGKTPERFCVAQTCFSYSKYVITGGFNTTSADGGPIRDGLPVRVTHVGNRIVKIEVAQ